MLHRSPRRVHPVAAALVKGELGLVPSCVEPLLEVKGLGPRAAIAKAGFGAMKQSDRLKWVVQARLDAILGSCRLSLASWLSGLRCYYAFIGVCLVVFMRYRFSFLCLPDAIRPGCAVYFPPKLDELVAWTTMFRSIGTLSNYLGYVRTGCIIVEVPVVVWS